MDQGVERGKTSDAFLGCDKSERHRNLKDSIFYRSSILAF